MIKAERQDRVRQLLEEQGTVSVKEISDALGLDLLHLIADEDRRMILYHTSNAVVMIGNSIVCRQIQYSVSFGDVIYITSQDGAYELEMHYITVIQ